MDNYIYLGYGITDNNGIAKLDHDAQGNPIDHSYTGTGAGELDIIASLDDNTHISDSSIQSKPCDVLDCIFCDDGTSTSKDSYWTPTNTTLVRQPTGTVLTRTGTTTGLNVRTSITAPCIIETDVLQVDGATSGFFITFNKDNTQLTGTSVIRVGGALNTWIHLKMEVTTNNVRVTNMDTGNYEDRPMTDVPNQFRFRTSGDTNTIQFRNFKVYPL